MFVVKRSISDKDYQKISGKRYHFKHLERLILYRSKQHAREHSLPFNLTLNDITIPEFCSVLGLRLSRSVVPSKHRYHNTPSIDRIKPKLGYVTGNVRIISWRANMLKSNGTLEEMRLVLEDLERIHGRPQYGKRTDTDCQ